MTNTKFRKRALLSSVAMLLVALVALGSATFAWFTSSTTATANGLKVSTIKSSELVISKSDLAWDTTVDYNQTSALYTPVSTANGTNWYEANAADKSNFAKDPDDEFTPVTNANNHWYTEALNIGNRGYAAVDNVQIQISGLSCNYARLAIYRVTANNGTTGYTPEGGTQETFVAGIKDNAGVAYDAVTGATTTTSITPSTTLTINVGTLDGKPSTAGANDLGGVAYYKFYIWFEGQDQQCVDANAGASFSNLTDGLTFSVSGTTAS